MFPLYLEFIKIKIESAIEYKRTFLIWFFAQFFLYGAQFLLIWILIEQFNQIGDWKPFEVAFLFALNFGARAVAGFFLYEPAMRLPQMIQTGEFDDVLTKPLNSFMYLMSREFNFGFISQLFLAVTFMVVCLFNIGVPLTPIAIFYLLIVIMGGALIHGAAFLFTSVPAFWLIRSDSFRLIIESQNFIKYPISIYDKGIQILLTVLLPYAFINFFPAQYFLQKEDFTMFHPIFQYLSPVVGICLFSLAYIFWNIGIKHYSSTGS